MRSRSSVRKLEEGALMGERQIHVAKMPNGEWCAAFDEWDLGDPMGWGKTKEEAVADLEAQLEDGDDSDRYEHETGAKP
jgi:hypothetical protein